MDKKDFIFPGAILGFVIITALGLLLTHSDTPPLIPNDAAATTTTASTSAESATTSPQTVISSSHPATTPHAPSYYYPYGTVTLALNQPATFKDGSVSIRPIAVLEDSRCPADVQCIQAGTVKLSLKVNVGGVARTETIQIGQSITAGPDTITLHAVSPVRTTQGAPAPSAYRFTFIVSRVQ